MKETYWNQFMTTGKVEYYLNYKMNQPGEEKESFPPDGKEQRESDCSDRDGAVNNTGGRI